MKKRLSQTLGSGGGGGRGAGVRQSIAVAQELISTEGVLGDAQVRNSAQVQTALHELADTVDQLERSDTAEGVLKATEALQQLQEAADAAKAEVEIDAPVAAPGPSAEGDAGAESEADIVRMASAQRKLARRAEGPGPALASVQFKPVPRETVKSRDRASRKVLKLTGNDLLYGETALIEGLWVFERELDPEALRQGLEDFLTESPSFAGRMDPKKGGVKNTNDGVPFTVQYADGSHFDVADDPSPHTDWMDKRNLSGVWSGKEPLLTVCLTQLMQGGSVLGIVVSHGVAGGAGFFGVCLPRLAAFTRAAAGQGPDALQGTLAPVEERTAFPAYPKRSVKTLQQHMGTLERRPLDFRDALLGGLKRSLFYLVLTSAVDRPRVKVHFGKRELDNIKAHASKGLRRAKWLSTGEALVSHLTLVMDQLTAMGSLAPVHVGIVCDYTPRLKADLPPGFIANTFYLHSVPLPGVGDAGDQDQQDQQDQQDLDGHHQGGERTLSGVAECVHEGLQGALGDRERLIENMQLQEELLLYGFQPNPALMMRPGLIFNNQSKFSALISLDFGTGTCSKYVPHAAGDSVLLVPSVGDGIDAWLSTPNAVLGDPLRLASDPNLLAHLHQFAD